MSFTSFTLEVQPGSDALDRVVCVCRRRNLQIVALDYASDRLALTVGGADRQMRGIESWLAALVSVSAVRRV